MGWKEGEAGLKRSIESSKPCPCHQRVGASKDGGSAKEALGEVQGGQEGRLKRAGIPQKHPERAPAFRFGSKCWDASREGTECPL